MTHSPVLAFIWLCYKFSFPLAPSLPFPYPPLQSDPYNDVTKPSDIYYPIYGTLTVRSRESPNVTSRIHFIQTVPSNSYSQFNL
ncbi:hypothetical protein M8J76_010291 [Diaphorina citri]|nr:hypothetical protein M8J76_010291 [Diaphorina citri]